MLVEPRPLMKTAPWVRLMKNDTDRLPPNRLPIIFGAARATVSSLPRATARSGASSGSGRVGSGGRGSLPGSGGKAGFSLPGVGHTWGGGHTCGGAHFFRPQATSWLLSWALTGATARSRAVPPTTTDCHRACFPTPRIVSSLRMRPTVLELLRVIRPELIL